MDTKFIVFFSSIFAMFATLHEISCDLQFFDPIVKECNTTFPVPHDFIHIQDIDQMLETMKTVKNGKCFDHCCLQKMNLVDTKGNVRKNELFENVAKLLNEIPEPLKQDLKISPELKKLILAYIDKCEQSDAVKKTTDACEKIYQLVLCFQDVEIE